MRTKQSKANREARAAGKARQVRSSALGKLLIMLAVVAAIVFGVAIFFKVNTIEVQGNSVYSADQIIEASQIQQGDNLLTVNKALAVGNIKAALPYVEDVSIARSLPDGIIIAAIHRGNDVIIPNGNTIIRENDRVIILCLLSEIPELERLFRTKKFSFLK